MTFIDMNDLVHQVRVNAHGQMTEVVREIAKNYRNLINTRENDFRRANRASARYAQERMLDSYRSQLNAGRVSGYRSGAAGVWKRYSGGALEDALASDEMFNVGAEWVEFVNRNFLDKRAKQWYRLNFGTESGGGRPARRTDITFLGVATGISVGFNYAPSRDFRIPSGFFIDQAGNVQNPNPGRRGTDEFMPYSYWRRQRRGSFAALQRMTGGEAGVALMRKRTGAIAARRFLDDGLAVLAREFPEGQEQVLGSIAVESVRSARRIQLGSRYRYVRVKTFRAALEGGLFPGYSGWDLSTNSQWNRR